MVTDRPPGGRSGASCSPTWQKLRRQLLGHRPPATGFYVDVELSTHRDSPGPT
jgi:hypothetical protein